MCRMLAHLGPPCRLAQLTDEPPHGLEHQSWAPRLMTSGVVNADGWGAAWYLPGEEDAAVYRATVPIWADANRFALGRTVASRCLLAAVRSATDPLSLSVGNTQPFVRGPLAFLHNGFVGSFRQRLMRRTRRLLTDETEALLLGDTDSEHLWGVFLDRHAAATGVPPGERLVLALSGMLEEARCAIRDAGVPALLAFIVSDGQHLAFVRSAVDRPAPSLFVQHSERGLRVASEPLDDAADWRPVEEDAVELVGLGPVSA